MNAADVSEYFVLPMRRRFVVPDRLPEADFLADMADALAPYSAHQLAEAAKWFRDNRAARTFPTVAECRQACERFPASPVVVPFRNRFTSNEERRSEAIAKHERAEDAARLCRGAPVARVARQEGWLHALLEFVTDNGRLPDHFEAQRVRDRSWAVDANLHSEPRPIMYRSLCELRQNMQDQGARLVFGSHALDAAE